MKTKKSRKTASYYAYLRGVTMMLNRSIGRLVLSGKVPRVLVVKHKKYRATNNYKR